MGTAGCVDTGSQSSRERGWGWVGSGVCDLEDERGSRDREKERDSRELQEGGSDSRVVGREQAGESASRREMGVSRGHGNSG